MSDEGGTVYDNRTQSVSEALLLKLPRLVGTLGSPHHVLTGTLSEHQHHVLTGTLSKHQRTDYYTGEYVVTPSTEEQTLNTKDRFLSRDVLVEEIPYYETTNESGGYTVIIG